MPWQHKIRFLIGQPVGISLTNGQGISGILCGTSNGKLIDNSVNLRIATIGIYKRLLEQRRD